MLLLIGVLVGNSGFALLPSEAYAWFELLTTIALTMVAFLLGSALSGKVVAQRGDAILSISLSVVLATLVIVPLGLVAIGVDPGLALILGAIAGATDPAAVTDVIAQSRVENRFTDTLKGVVAIDDGWGLIAFSAVLLLAGQSNGSGAVIVGLLHDLGGALLLGLAVGVPAAFLTGRVAAGEPLQAEAMGIVFLTSGLAIWLEVSFLIAGMTAGAVIVNLARHHERAFHEIEHLQWPFLLLFFLLAGASLQVGALMEIGWIGLSYLCLRVAARLVGGPIGGRLSAIPRNEAMLYGPSLLPQAGVAVGMALVAGEAFPDWSGDIMALAIASTVIFELVGPPITHLAIRRSDLQ